MKQKFGRSSLERHELSRHRSIIIGVFAVLFMATALALSTPGGLLQGNLDGQEIANTITEETVSITNVTGETEILDPERGTNKDEVSENTSPDGLTSLCGRVGYPALIARGGKYVSICNAERIDANAADIGTIVPPVRGGWFILDMGPYKDVSGNDLRFYEGLIPYNGDKPEGGEVWVGNKSANLNVNPDSDGNPRVTGWRHLATGQAPPWKTCSPTDERETLPNAINACWTISDIDLNIGPDSGEQYRYVYYWSDGSPYGSSGTDVNGFALKDLAVCPDADSDGLCDAQDNCPNVFNPNQRDSNSNGQGDLCDSATLSSLYYCGRMEPFNNSSEDASVPLQTCIDRINTATSYGLLLLPAGTYTLKRQVRVTKPLTIMAPGLLNGAVTCGSTPDPTQCTIFVLSAPFADAYGAFDVQSSGVRFDHLVIDGNKTLRTVGTAADKCRAGDNKYGFNMIAGRDDFSFVSSTSKNALCGTGLQIGSNIGVTIAQSNFTANGFHDRTMLWADGLTLGDPVNAVVRDNTFNNNTDIDLIFGGCRNCKVHNNTIVHDGSYPTSAFGALLLYKWPASSGNFTGSEIAYNSINCGAGHGCGFGIYLGADVWNAPTPLQPLVYGGSVHDNTIHYPQLGLIIDEAHDVKVYQNEVKYRNPYSNTGCAAHRTTHDFVKGTRSYAIDTTLDTFRSVYVTENWDACIPNTSPL